MKESLGTHKSDLNSNESII